jgi:hypothetical protein
MTTFARLSRILFFFFFPFIRSQCEILHVRMPLILFSCLLAQQTHTHKNAAAFFSPNQCCVYIHLSSYMYTRKQTRQSFLDLCYFFPQTVVSIYPEKNKFPGSYVESLLARASSYIHFYLQFDIKGAAACAPFHFLNS